MNLLYTPRELPGSDAASALSPPPHIEGLSSESEREEDGDAAETGHEAYLSTCRQLGITPCGRWARALSGALEDASIPHYGIGPRGAVAVGASLALNECLRSANLSDNRLSADGAEVIASALLANGALQVLNLSHNAIGADGCRALSQALCTAEHLVSLSLAANGLGDKGVNELMGALLEGGAMLVQHLSLADNKIGPMGASDLVRALHDEAGGRTALRHLDLRWNNLGHSGAAILAKGLLAPVDAPVPSLVQLDLQWNLLGDEGAKQLAAALPRASSLQLLALGHNNIGAEGARALAAAVASLGLEIAGSDGPSVLEALSLDSNPLGREGVHALIEGLESAQPSCPIRTFSVNDAGLVPSDRLYERLESALAKLGAGGAINEEPRSPQWPEGEATTQLSKKHSIANEPKPEPVLPSARRRPSKQLPPGVEAWDNRAGLQRPKGEGVCGSGSASSVSRSASSSIASSRRDSKA